jgi:superfamily I DNA and/or RNA helicase
MPAQIAHLVKMPVYGGDYETPDDDGAVSQPLVCRAFPAPVVFLDTSAQPAPGEEREGTSSINRQEAGWVREVCRTWNRELVSRNAPRVSVSVLAFYGAQAKLLRRELGYPRFREFPKLEFKLVDSVDRIQGQESDLVIVSFCRTFGTGEDRKPRKPNSIARPGTGYARWLQNVNRLNVACTRARRQLILVGHGNTLRALNGVKAAEGFYKNLFDFVDAGNGGILLHDLKPVDTRGRRN